MMIELNILDKLCLAFGLLTIVNSLLILFLALKFAQRGQHE